MFHAGKQFFATRSGRFIVKLAERYKEFEDALRLRFDVFNRELNEGLSAPYLNGMDRDEYDDYCDHLIVVDAETGETAGTYRMLLGNVSHLFGCGSLHIADPGEVNMVYSYMNAFHRAESQCTVYPLKKMEGIGLHPISDGGAVLEKLPPLIKGYIRLGAKICGEPAYDDEFGTTDFFIMLETEKLIARYGRRFFQETVGELCSIS